MTTGWVKIVLSLQPSSSCRFSRSSHHQIKSVKNAGATVAARRKALDDGENKIEALHDSKWFTNEVGLTTQ